MMVDLKVDEMVKMSGFLWENLMVVELVVSLDFLMDYLMDGHKAEKLVAYLVLPLVFLSEY